MPEPKVVLDGEDMRRTLTRIAHEIVENGGDPERLALVGIHRRGAVLAERLQRLVDDLHDVDVPLGDLDISFYRDDVTTRGGAAGRPRHAPRLRRRRAHGRHRRRRPLHRSHGPRRDRGALRLRPPRPRPARRARRPRPPRAAAAAPTTSARTCRPRAPSASSSASTELDGEDERDDLRAKISGDRRRTSRRHPRPDASRRLSVSTTPSPTSATTSSACSTAPPRSRRSRTATSRRSPRCAGAPCSTSSTRRARARARPSSSPPSACRADVVNFAASGSSVEKGESLKDTVLTLDARTRPTRSSSARPTRAPPRSSRAGRPPRSSTPATASTSTRPRRCSTSSRCARSSARSTAARSGSSATSRTRASRARTSSPSG